MKDLSEVFSWQNLESAIGQPYEADAIKQLFAQAGVNPDESWREVRVGIDSMPPRDRQPASTAEIDLSSSHYVRLRFKRAGEMIGAATDDPQQFVLATVTYFLDPDNAGQGFQGTLPVAIRGSDTPQEVMARMDRPPTDQRLEPQRQHGYVAWEDRSPVLHVLFDMQRQRVLRVNVFLAQAPAQP